MLKKAMIDPRRSDQRIDNCRPIAIDIVKTLVQVLPSVCCSIYEATCLQPLLRQLSMVSLGLGNCLVQNSITDISHAVQLQDLTFGADNKSLSNNLNILSQTRRGVLVNIKSADKHICPVLSRPKS